MSQTELKQLAKRCLDLNTGTEAAFLAPLHILHPILVVQRPTPGQRWLLSWLARCTPQPVLLSRRTKTPCVLPQMLFVACFAAVAVSVLGTSAVPARCCGKHLAEVGGRAKCAGLGGERRAGRNPDPQRDRQRLVHGACAAAASRTPPVRKGVPPLPLLVAVIMTPTQWKSDDALPGVLYATRMISAGHLQHSTPRTPSGRVDDAAW